MYRAKGCIYECVSCISQEDADLCALRQSVYCDPCNEVFDASCDPCNSAVEDCCDPATETCQPCDPALANCFPCDPATDPSCTPPPVECNDEQVILLTTDEGTFGYVIPAGTFCSNDTDPNDDANNWGDDQVQSNKFFLSTITDFVCYLDDYLFQITTSDGSTPAAWSITSGDLPAGMFLSDTGLIFGNPGEFGTFVFTVRATKSTGHYAERAYSLTVGGVTTLVLADGTEDVAYTDQLASTGITGGAWSIAAGALPDGLTMDATGLISGTPTTPGTFTFTVQVTGT